MRRGRHVRYSFLMTSEPQTAKPPWVKLTCWAVVLTLGVPLLMSLLSSAYRSTWQLVALLIAGVWLAVSGFFTLYSPLPMERYFGRPGAYQFMRDHPPSVMATWCLRLIGIFMLLLGLAVAGGCSLLLLPIGGSSR